MAARGARAPPLVSGVITLPVIRCCCEPARCLLLANIPAADKRVATINNQLDVEPEDLAKAGLERVVSLGWAGSSHSFSNRKRWLNGNSFMKAQKGKKISVRLQYSTRTTSTQQHLALFG